MTGRRLATGGSSGAACSRTIGEANSRFQATHQIAQPASRLDRRNRLLRAAVGSGYPSAAPKIKPQKKSDFRMLVTE
jgi:hypothetical protein